MGVLNVTPDSFSDGGEFFDTDKAVEHGLQMAADGAAIVDVGGESTRPGSASGSADEQIRRVVPVIKALCKKTEVPISIDTHKFQVAKAALEAGAAMINDITALSDERVAELAAEQKVPVVLMHMQGTPATMQIEPEYDDVVGEVREFLLERAKKAERLGISKDMIFIDPGIGFGKTLEHNLEIIERLGELRSLGRPILIGTSRKSFIGKVLDRPVGERLWGTAATVALSIANGAKIIRVHDVDQMRQVAQMSDAVLKGKEVGNLE